VKEAHRLLGGQVTLGHQGGQGGGLAGIERAKLEFGQLPITVQRRHQRRQRMIIAVVRNAGHHTTELLRTHRADD
jgi:hypothetical protein